jgi:hypothetical protein
VPAVPFTTPYDPDRWIHVPLDYVDSPWADAGEWAAWVADAALRDREGGEAVRDAVREEALSVALFPAEHVSFRFWHYPNDAEPSGFADIFVQAREDDGTSPADLLPELAMTAVTPALTDVEAAGQRAAVRRLSLGVVARPGTDGEPMLVPKAEYLGVTAGWVTYVLSVDFDVNALEGRLDDLDALFAGIEFALATAS